MSNTELIASLLSEAAVMADYMSAIEKLADAWDEGYAVGNAHNGRRDANPYRSAVAKNRDPEPWVEREAERRLSQREVDEGNKRGRCWRGLAWDPRPEFETSNAQQNQETK